MSVAIAVRGPVVAITGNPKQGSRTADLARRAAHAIAADLGGPDVHEADLAEDVTSQADAREAVVRASVAVVASPTFKATYSGLLKTLLDGFPRLALDRVVAVPLMVHASPEHALAADLHLRPLLLELGATCPTPSIAIAEADLPRADELIDAWLARSGWALRAVTAAAAA